MVNVSSVIIVGTLIFVVLNSASCFNQVGNHFGVKNQVEEIKKTSKFLKMSDEVISEMGTQ